MGTTPDIRGRGCGASASPCAATAAPLQHLAALPVDPAAAAAAVVARVVALLAAAAVRPWRR